MRVTIASDDLLIVRYEENEPIAEEMRIPISNWDLSEVKNFGKPNPDPIYSVVEIVRFIKTVSTMYYPPRIDDFTPPSARYWHVEYRRCPMEPNGKLAILAAVKKLKQLQAGELQDDFQIPKKPPMTEFDVDLSRYFTSMTITYRDDGNLWRMITSGSASMTAEDMGNNIKTTYNTSNPPSGQKSGKKP